MKFLIADDRIYRSFPQGGEEVSVVGEVRELEKAFKNHKYDVLICHHHLVGDGDMRERMQKLINGSNKRCVHIPSILIITSSKKVITHPAPFHYYISFAELYAIFILNLQTPGVLAQALKELLLKYDIQLE